MKRIIALLTALLMVTVIFAGCGSSVQGTKADTTDTASAPAAASTVQQEQSAQAKEPQSTLETTAFPLKVKDAKNVEMTIEKKPEKIVSLTLGTDEMLFSLVDRSRIVGITNLSTDPGLSNIVDAAKDFPVKLNNTDVEKIISLQPDLIFMADWNDEKIVKQLRDAKFNVYVYKTPSGVDEQKKTIMEIARLVGDDKKGQELTAWMDSKLKAVEDKVKTIGDDKKLTAMCLDSFYYTYGKNTTFDDIAARAGLINLGVKAGITGWQQITKEKIVEMNPDVIFLPAWSYQGFDAKKFADDFKKDKSLAGVKAVKNNRVYMIPDAHMTSISQNIVLGVEDTAKAVYPDLFK